MKIVCYLGLTFRTTQREKIFLYNLTTTINWVGAQDKHTNRGVYRISPGLNNPIWNLFVHECHKRAVKYLLWAYSSLERLKWSVWNPKHIILIMLIHLPYFGLYCSHAKLIIMPNLHIIRIWVATSTGWCPSKGKLGATRLVWIFPVRMLFSVSGKCLALTEKKDKLAMEVCDDNNDRQHWLFQHLYATIS